MYALMVWLSWGIGQGCSNIGCLFCDFIGYDVIMMGMDVDFP